MARPLFPVHSVPDGMKAKAVFGMCRRTGYGWDTDTSTWDAAAYAWWDQTANNGNGAGTVTDPSYAAAEAHYDSILTGNTDRNPLVAIFKDQARRAKAELVVDPEF